MKQIFLLLLSGCLLLAVTARGAVTLTGDTNNPKQSFFIKGKPVLLTFRVSGMSPNAKDVLFVDILDQNETSLKKSSVPVSADEKGNWKTTVSAPNDRFGFYRVRARLSGGVTLPKVGSRPAGCLTYAVLPDPSARKLYPQKETFFGLHGAPGRHNQISPWLGARWGMSGLSADKKKFEEARKKPSDFNWKGYRHISWISQNYSRWPAEDLKHLKGKGVGIYFTDSAGEKIFTEKMKELISRGKEQYGDNETMLYQPQWEPDLYMSDEAILNIHRAACNAARAVDPNAKVFGPVLSTISGESVERHRRLFEMGLLNYIDEISIHPYLQYPVEENGLVENVRLLKKYVKQYARGREIPIRGTESGYSARATMEQELIQMYGQLRQSLILLGEGFASNDPFYGYDFDVEGSYGLTYNLMIPKQIWGPERIAPRPVFPALSAASYLLEGHKSTGPIEYLGDTVLGYSYADRSDHCVIALWDFGGHTPEVDIPVGRAEIEVADMMGNRKKVKTDGGTVKVRLSEAPVYLIGVDPALWGRNAVKNIRPARTEFESMAGTAVELSGTVHADGKAIAGELRLVFPERMKQAVQTKKIHIPAGGSAAFRFFIDIPAMQADGKYPCMLKLTGNGKTISVNGVLLNVKAPVELKTIEPDFQEGVPGLRVDLVNLTSNELGGSFETRVSGFPEARKRIAFSLKAKERKAFRAAFDGFEVSPFLEFKAQVSVRLNSGYALGKTATVNFLSAGHLPGVGKNGDFSGWKTPEYYPVPETAVRSPQFHNGPKDLSAKIAFGWNEQYLLFDVLVHDDVFFQNKTGWATWNGDALQFGFARNRTVPKSANEFAEQTGLAFSEIDFALTKNGPETYRTFSFNKEALPPGPVDGKTAPLKISKTVQPDGSVRIRYQIAVPWRFLNVERAVAGRIVYWAGMVNDRDNAKQPDVSALGVFQLKQAPPKYFGAIVLAE